MKRTLKNNLIQFGLGFATLFTVFGGATLAMLLLMLWLF